MKATQSKLAVFFSKPESILKGKNLLSLGACFFFFFFLLLEQSLIPMCRKANRSHKVASPGKMVENYQEYAILLTLYMLGKNFSRRYF